MLVQKRMWYKLYWNGIFLRVMEGGGGGGGGGGGLVVESSLRS